MSFNLDSLFIEWRRIVPTGIPNPKNAYHLTLLKEICLSKGISTEVVDSVMLVLEAEEKPLDDKEKEKADKMGLKWKGKGYGKESEKGISHKNVDGKLVAVGDDEEKEEPSEDKITPNEFESDPDKGGGYLSKDKKKDDKENKEQKLKSKEKLLSKDHETVENTLRYTKTKAKKDKESGGRVGVGLGTDTSRAGEAAVHTGIRMLQDGKSIDEIQNELMNIANDKDTFLDKKWVNATTSTLNSIQEKIGVENIDDVSWDTPEGREAIGVDTKLETSADMFVKTKDGRNVGISLKQDGSVFLNNGGWAKQSGLLLDKLKEQMPDEEHAELVEAMSIDNYNVDRSNRFKEVSSKYSAEEILKLTNSLKPDEIKKVGLGGGKPTAYMDILKNSQNLLEKANSGTLSGDEMKSLHRLLKLKDKEGEKYIRESDDFLTQKAFSVLNKSDSAKKGMNKHVLKSMHVLDTLGLNETLKLGGVDDFVTMYGIPPDGAVLDEKNLTDLFGTEFGEVLLERIDEVRNKKKEPKDLEEFMADKIEINYDSGEILFKHENEMKYPLFYMSGRSRGIGSAPVMELGQTSFMALALKVGSFDTDKWTPEQLNKLSKELKKEKDERDAKRMEEE